MEGPLRELVPARLPCFIFRPKGGSVGGVKTYLTSTLILRLGYGPTIPI